MKIYITSARSSKIFIMKIALVLILRAETQVAIRILPNYGSSYVITTPEPVTSAFKECPDSLRGLWLIFKDAEIKVKVSHNRPKWPKGFRVG